MLIDSWNVWFKLTSILNLSIMRLWLNSFVPSWAKLKTWEWPWDEARDMHLTRLTMSVYIIS
jgi:hypothetical protein